MTTHSMSDLCNSPDAIASKNKKSGLYASVGIFRAGPRHDSGLCITVSLSLEHNQLHHITQLLLRPAPSHPHNEETFINPDLDNQLVMHFDWSLLSTEHRVLSSSLLIMPGTLLARRSINYYITGPLMLS